MARKNRNRNRNQWHGWVKLQRSIVTSTEQPQMLVYNEDRSLVFQCDLPDDIAEAMGARLRMYCKASLRQDGQLVLDFATLTEEQPW